MATSVHVSASCLTMNSLFSVLYLTLTADERRNRMWLSLLLADPLRKSGSEASCLINLARDFRLCKPIVVDAGYIGLTRRHGYAAERKPSLSFSTCIASPITAEWRALFSQLHIFFEVLLPLSCIGDDDTMIAAGYFFRLADMYIDCKNVQSSAHF